MKIMNKLHKVRLHKRWTAILIPIIAALAIYRTGSDGILQGMLYFLFLLTLLLIAETDYYTYKIPDILNLLLFINGLIFSIFFSNGDMIRRLAGTLIIPLLFLVMDLIKPGSIGGGDIKLMAAAGVFIGPVAIIYAAIIGSLLAGFIMTGLLLSRRAGRTARMPMAPYYAIGIVVTTLGIIPPY